MTAQLPDINDGPARKGLAADDIAAARDAGIIDSGTAAELEAFVCIRQRRLDDEPVRVFKGFAEVFVSVGLTIAIAGASAVIWSNFGGYWPPLLTLAACCALLPFYFVRRRGMVLPGIILALGWSAAVVLGLARVFGILDFFQGHALQQAAAVHTAAMIAWYAVHRVPFALFLASLSVLALLLSFAPGIEFALARRDLPALFSLTAGTYAPILTFVFGCGATAVAMVFDLSDPRRTGNASACAFWLHLSAAPAIVNCVAWSAWSAGGDLAAGLAALALVPILLFALLVDRRSFAAAGTVWGWVLLAQVFDQDGLTLLLLGTTVVLLATFWSGLRSKLFRALPDWAWLDRLPPVSHAGGQA